MTTGSLRKKRRFQLVVAVFLIGAASYSGVRAWRIYQQRKRVQADEARERERERRRSAAVERVLASAPSELDARDLGAGHVNSFANGELHSVYVYRKTVKDASGWICWVWAKETESGCRLAGLSRALGALGLGSEPQRLTEVEWAGIAIAALDARAYPENWQSAERECSKLGLHPPRVERRPEGGLTISVLDRESDMFVTLTTSYYESTLTIAPSGEAKSDKRRLCRTSPE